MLEESYNEYLIGKFKELFSKNELEAFLEANEKERPVVLRVNTLLRRRKDLSYMLKNRKVDCENLDWTDTGIVTYKSSVPLGATPEYLAGYYMIQGAASMLPTLNLDLKEDLVVVDLCAAPGGKSTHIAALMNNTGILYCNDICKERIDALKSNLMRMGITNCIVTNMNAKDFNVGKVDRVLLDAPCSGTGVISKDSSIKTSKSEKEIKNTSNLQKELILHAFDMLNKNGIMVYSTCSILVEENESVVNHLLMLRSDARVCEMEISIGQNGFTHFRNLEFNGSLKFARRTYPHVHNMDGFFYCKIRKI